MKKSRKLKLILFLISMLLFQVLVVIVVSLKSIISYKILNKPKYISECREIDFDCVDYCNRISDFSYTKGFVKNCDYSDASCCIEYEYIYASISDVIKEELKFWIPVTSFGIGILFSYLVSRAVYSKMKSSKEQ